MILRKSLAENSPRRYEIRWHDHNHYGLIDYNQTFDGPTADKIVKLLNKKYPRYTHYKKEIFMDS